MPIMRNKPRSRRNRISMRQLVAMEQERREEFELNLHSLDLYQPPEHFRVALFGLPGTGRRTLAKSFLRQVSRYADSFAFSFPAIYGCRQMPLRFTKRLRMYGNMISVDLEVYLPESFDLWMSSKEAIASTHGVILLYDVTNRKSFAHAQRMAAQLRSSDNIRNSDCVPLSLLGTKLDLSMPYDEAEYRAELAEEVTLDPSTRRLIYGRQHSSFMDACRRGICAFRRACSYYRGENATVTVATDLFVERTVVSRRMVGLAEGALFAASADLTFFEVSARTGVNVELAFTRVVDELLQTVIPDDEYDSVGRMLLQLPPIPAAMVAPSGYGDFEKVEGGEERKGKPESMAEATAEEVVDPRAEFNCASRESGFVDGAGIKYVGCSSSASTSGASGSGFQRKTSAPIDIPYSAATAAAEIQSALRRYDSGSLYEDDDNEDGTSLFCPKAAHYPGFRAIFEASDYFERVRATAARLGLQQVQAKIAQRGAVIAGTSTTLSGQNVSRSSTAVSASAPGVVKLSNGGSGNKSTGTIRDNSSCDCFPKKLTSPLTPLLSVWSKSFSYIWRKLKKYCCCCCKQEEDELHQEDFVDEGTGSTAVPPSSSNNPFLPLISGRVIGGPEGHLGSTLSDQDLSLGGSAFGRGFRYADDYCLCYVSEPLLGDSAASGRPRVSIVVDPGAEADVESDGYGDEVHLENNHPAHDFPVINDEGRDPFPYFTAALAAAEEEKKLNAEVERIFEDALRKIKGEFDKVDVATDNGKSDLDGTEDKDLKNGSPAERLTSPPAPRPARRRVRHPTEMPQYAAGNEPWLRDDVVADKPWIIDFHTGRPNCFRMWTEHVPCVQNLVSNIVEEVVDENADHNKEVKKVDKDQKEAEAGPSNAACLDRVGGDDKGDDKPGDDGQAN